MLRSSSHLFRRALSRQHALLRCRRALSTQHALRAASASHIDLEEIDRGLYRARRQQLWVPPGAKAVFGGQVLGQALHAAQLSVRQRTEGLSPISLHSYFLQRGAPSSDIIYQIKETSDLRSFSSRSVEAIQFGEVIFKMQAQFGKTSERSRISHASPMPDDGVLPPHACPSLSDLLDSLEARAPAALLPLIDILRVSPVDVRYADGVLPDPLDLEPPRQTSRQRLWVRIREPIDDATLHDCCAAYLSDQPLLLTALRPHGLQFPSPKVGPVATLDHSMWFHASFAADEWLLYDMHSPHAGSGRALCFGHLYRPDSGALVVSAAQQGVLRLARPSLKTTAATLAWRAANAMEWVRGRGRA